MIAAISWSTAAQANATASGAAAASGRLAAPGSREGAGREGSGTGGDRAAASGGQSLSLSPLGRQLAASADRADDWTRSLTRTELAQASKRILDGVTGDSYYANKAIHDAEVPDTDDPAVLARAAQATAYLADASQGGHTIRNPFAGLSREQLASIVYDESGSYTVNERHAAWRESYEQEQAWRRKVVAEGMAEYSRTGKMTHFFQSVLEHFNELPEIEQAQYPKEYALDLQSRIALDFNYRTGVPGEEAAAPMGLISMLLQQDQPQAPD